MPAKKKNVVKELVLDEVSFCGVGMNQGSNVALYKGTFTKEQFEKALMTFKDVLTEMAMTEELEKIVERICTMSNAFRSAIFSVLYSEEEGDKKAALKESVMQYVEALNAMADGDDFSKAQTAVEEWIASNPEGSPEELVKHLTTLSKEETMSKELEAKLKKAEEDAKANAEALKKANRLAEMSDAQKEFYKGLPEDKQEGFLKKSAEQMDKEIAKAKEGDESLTVEGHTIKKSEVGAAAFAIMKAQQLRLDKQEETLTKTKEELVRKALEEEAERELPHLPGTPAEKAEMWKGAKGNEASVKMLKAADAAMAKSMKESGTDDASASVAGTASEKLDKMAAEKAEKDGITFHKAYDAILKTKEGEELYKQTLQ